MYVYEGAVTAAELRRNWRDTKTLHMQELPIVPSVCCDGMCQYAILSGWCCPMIPCRHIMAMVVLFGGRFARVDGNGQPLGQAHEELLVRSSVAAGAGQRSSAYRLPRRLVRLPWHCSILLFRGRDRARPRNRQSRGGFRRHRVARHAFARGEPSARK